MSHCTPNAEPWRASGSEISVDVRGVHRRRSLRDGNPVVRLGRERDREAEQASRGGAPTTAGAGCAGTPSVPYRRSPPDNPCAARPHGFATPRGRQAIPARPSKASPFSAGWKSPDRWARAGVGRSTHRTPPLPATVSFHGAWRGSGACCTFPCFAAGSFRGVPTGPGAAAEGGAGGCRCRCRRRRAGAVEPRPGRTVPITAKRPQRGRSRALEVLVIVALLGVLGVVVPVLVADHYGALGIPRSDDWSYLLTLFRWVDTGKLTFNGWVSMTLVGQVAIAAPLVGDRGPRASRRSNCSPRCSDSSACSASCSSAGRWCARRGGRCSWPRRSRSGPLWGPLAPTYMTDVPTFTFEMLTLAAAAVAFRRRPLSMAWFAVSLVLGFVGVTIRQYAVIPVIAIVMVAVALLVIDKQWRKLTPVLVLSAIFAIASLAILYWWSGLPGLEEPLAHLPHRAHDQRGPHQGRRVPAARRAPAAPGRRARGSGGDPAPGVEREPQPHDAADDAHGRLARGDVLPGSEDAVRRQLPLA